MKKATLAAVLLLALHVMALPARTPMQSPENPDAEDANVRKIENRIFDLTNEMRKKENLKPFKKEPGLADAARNHSRDMAKRGYMAHVSPEGMAPWDRVSAEHRTLIGVVGENIHFSEGLDVNNVEQVASYAVEWWMKSPGHRANILSKKFTHLGIGVAIIGNKVLSTQKFADVHAYLDNPLPKKVKKGEALNLKATPVKPDRKNPVSVHFYDRKKDRVAAGPFLIEGAKADIKPGEYLVRFYFPREDAACIAEFGEGSICVDIIDGPSIIVEK